MGYGTVRAIRPGVGGRYRKRERDRDRERSKTAITMYGGLYLRSCLWRRGILRGGRGLRGRRRSGRRGDLLRKICFRPDASAPPATLRGRPRPPSKRLTFTNPSPPPPPHITCRPSRKPSSLLRTGRPSIDECKLKRGFD